MPWTAALNIGGWDGRNAVDGWPKPDRIAVFDPRKLPAQMVGFVAKIVRLSFRRIVP